MARHTPQGSDAPQSQPTNLPDGDADRVLDDDAGEDDVTQLRRREERHHPHALEEEDIGLQHVSGTDEAEIGKELNITGAEDIDGDPDEGTAVI